MEQHWTKAVSLAKLHEKNCVVFRHDGRQIALFATAQGVFACNNRCPHEGYPLSDGTLDEACRLTCNWHNWKFNLNTGENLYGGDRLRVYPTELRDGEVWIDLTDAPLSARREEALANLRNALDEHQYDRMAREVARLMGLGGDPLDAIRLAISWSHDRFEFGTTHAYAGAADWLRLFDENSNDQEAQLICLVETLGHIADDVMRERDGRFPYPEASKTFDEEAFVEAVEQEDESQAIALMRGGLAAGYQFSDFESALTRAALLHYADFGHSLIYVPKTGALIERLGQECAEPLLLALVRSIIFAWREDHLPEFRAYADILRNWGTDATDVVPDPSEIAGLNAKQAMKRLASSALAPPESLFILLLTVNSQNLLTYDMRYQEQIDGKIADNVGWLSFTHALTFANAVRRQCTKYPALWPAGLLQLACFSGRNAAYTDAMLKGDAWQVDDRAAFFETSVENLFDHAKEEFIVSVHLLKTVLAAREEAATAPSETAALITAALNRFLSSPLKRKHVRRTARQALDFVALDG